MPALKAGQQERPVMIVWYDGGVSDNHLYCLFGPLLRALPPRDSGYVLEFSLAPDIETAAAVLDRSVKTLRAEMAARIADLDAKSALAEVLRCACGKPSKSACSQCRAAFYCSEVCQRAAWSMHKAACRASASRSSRETLRTASAALSVAPHL